MLLQFFYLLSQSSAGGKDTPCNGLYGEAPFGRGNSFRLQSDERVGTSIRAVKRFKGLTESTDAFQAHEKVEKMFRFCGLFVFKRQCILQQLKGMQSSKVGM